MKLKQFLKPDWRKIAIFVIILLLEFLVLMFYSYAYAYSATATVYDSCCRNDLPEERIKSCRESNITEEFCIKYKEKLEMQSLRYDIILIIDLAVAYLLSCLIVWIYDKFRKK